MPYDKSLDQEIFSKSWEDETARITVSVLSYNGGPRKLQISRETRDAEGHYRFAKLGRLAKAEAEAILPLLTEAVSNLG
jgi:hypothetical protein